VVDERMRPVLSLAVSALCFLRCLTLVMMMMMMMSGFVDRIVNGPQMHYQSAEQVGLQMLSNHRGGESCRSQGGW